MNILIIRFVLLCAAASGSTHALAADETPATLCQPGEKIIFSCAIRNERIASICGSANEPKDTYAEYRFGNPRKIEFRYTASAKKPGNRIFVEKTESTSSAQPSYSLYFQNKGYGYSINILYDSVGEKYDSPTIFVNRAYSQQLDSWNEFNCKNVGRVTSQNFSAGLMPLHPNITSAEPGGYRKWLKKFGRLNSYNVRP